MLFHGIAKLSGIGFIAAKFSELGLPGSLGYLVVLGEFIAPIVEGIIEESVG